jgi:hypothetical protein
MSPWRVENGCVPLASRRIEPSTRSTSRRRARLSSRQASAAVVQTGVTISSCADRSSAQKRESPSTRRRTSPIAGVRSSVSGSRKHQLLLDADRLRDDVVESGATRIRRQRPCPSYARGSVNANSSRDGITIATSHLRFLVLVGGGPAVGG